jgi:hypothetical protein
MLLMRHFIFFSTFVAKWSSAARIPDACAVRAHLLDSDRGTTMKQASPPATLAESDPLP